MNYLLPFFTVVIWGGNAIINKMAASVIEPSAMSFYRWFLAFLLLTPFCLYASIRQWPNIKPNLAKIAFLALLGMVLNQSLGYYAGLSTSASNMSMIISLVPLITIFLSVPLLSKKLSVMTVIAALISILGLAYMLGKGDLLYFLNNPLNQGDALMLMATVVYAAYCVLLKRWKMPLSNWVFIYVQVVFAVIFLTPLWLSSTHLIAPVSAIPLIAYASILASIIAPWLWVKSIQLIGADNSAMFMNLLPVVTISLAVTLLSENLYHYHIVGGILVITGVIFAQIRWPKFNRLRFKNT
ncbi:drug/metabolite exporter family transporter [Psychromonas sp. CNPT3]|uniref:DMT family transporter n=1 Tax=Psychromonas sp. CNPT3 TaxID=314282 RepID=UPI00006E8ACE|nr:DMT family transporter [Psychromonas sp. CNPT3]AGH80498.1 drug/metabolite exporter family transporter [Psychromonas sp. CNPT3]